MKSYIEASSIPIFKLGGVSVPRVILGCQPFLGQSYQGPERNREYAARFSKIGNTLRVLVKASGEHGVTAVGVVPESEGRLATLLLKAIKKVMEILDVEIGVTPSLRLRLTVASKPIDDYRRWLSYFHYESKLAGKSLLGKYLDDPILKCREGWSERFEHAVKHSKPYSKEEINELNLDLENLKSRLECFQSFKVLFIEPGSECDFLAMEDRMDLLTRLVCFLKKEGFNSIVLGIHHAGSSIPILDSSDIKIDGYLTPVNKIGALMLPTKELALKAIKNSEKPIIAIKTMAGGRIPPREALEYVFGDVGVEACMIGVGSEQEADEDLPIAKEIIRKYFK